MKHYYFFLIITSLLLAGCGQKDRAKSQFESSVQTEESYPLAKEYIKEADNTYQLAINILRAIATFALMAFFFLTTVCI